MIELISGDLLMAAYLGSSVYVSQDDGKNWSSRYTFAGAYYQLGLSQLTGLNNELFIFQEGTGYMYVSTDDGVSWSRDAGVTGLVYNGGTCVQADGITLMAVTSGSPASNILTYERAIGGVYETIDVTVGTKPSCEQISMLANKYLPYNITHIKYFTGIYTDVFPIAAYPFNILSAIGLGNYTLFGMEGDGANVQPTFTSLIFDIQTVAAFLDTSFISWLYSAPAAAMSPLSIADHTATVQLSPSTGYSWTIPNVECISWEPPTDWSQHTIDGVTAFWVLATIADADLITIPTQQNRQIYTANLPYVDFDADQVTGDIPAIIEILLANEGDKDGPGTTSSPKGYSNRIMLGARSLDRGSNFIAYLNASDELTPLSVSCEVGESTTFADSLTAPAGRVVHYNPVGLEDLNMRAKWTIESIRSTEYHGTFHAFLRCFQSGGSPGDMQVKMKFVSGSGGIDYETTAVALSTLNDFYLMDFGRVDIPASSMIKESEAGDELTIEVHVSSVDGTPDFYIYDLIILPTDEWVCDTKDTVGNDDSAVEWGKSLDVDSVRHSKVMIRSLLGSGQTRGGLVSSVYSTDSTGPAVILPDKDQRLWACAATLFVAEGIHDGAANLAYLSDASGDFVNQGVKVGMIVVNETDGSEATITEVTATGIYGALVGGADNDWDVDDVGHVITDNWVSYPWICHSIQMWNNQRYLAARGAN